MLTFFELFFVVGVEFLVVLAFDGEKVFVSEPGDCSLEVGRVQLCQFAQTDFLLNRLNGLEYLWGTVFLTLQIVQSHDFILYFFVPVQYLHFDLLLEFLANFLHCYILSNK